MAKKFISIVLSVILAFSAFAICSFAGDTITDEDRELYPAEELEIADPEKRIDLALLSGKESGGSFLLSDVASEDVLEYNLSFWKDEIIDEYHALKAKGDAATDEEWGALYRKMKTPHNNDWSEENAYRDFWYEYRDESKAVADIKLVPSKTELKPGEEFSVDVYFTSNFYVASIYSTFFYNNKLVDIIGCDEKYKGTDLEFKGQQASDKNLFVPGPEFNGKYNYNEMTHYGDYTYGDYVLTFGDMRDVEWPDSIKALDNAMTDYEAYCLFIAPNVKDNDTVPAIKGDNTLYVTLKFKVKDDAKVGSTTNIIAPGDGVYSLDKLALYDEYFAQDKFISPCWQFMRVNKDSDACWMYMADQAAQYSQTMTSTPATISIVGDDVETADYTALDAAIANFNSSVSGLYTNASWTAYASAVSAGMNLSRDLLKEDQATVDAATKAITDAEAALVLNKLVSADVIGTPTIGSNATVQVVANGSPAAVRLVDGDGNALTFNREDATITTSGDNEIWSIRVAATAEKTVYTVFVKYGDAFAEEGLPLTIVATEGADLSIHSISIPDMYPAGTYMDGKIYEGVHDVIIRTSKDVFKIQFIDPDGNTRTFSSVDFTPVVDGDELVWTLPVKFSGLGAMNYGLRTRAVNTTFALTGDYITGRIVY